MDDTQFWTLMLVLVSLGLLFINFFRGNILFAIAGIMVNLGITQIVGTPKWLIYAAILIAVGEGVAGLLRLIGGKKKSKRFVG